MWLLSAPFHDKPIDTVDARVVSINDRIKTFGLHSSGDHIGIRLNIEGSARRGIEMAGDDQYRCRFTVCFIQCCRIHRLFLFQCLNKFPGFPNFHPRTRACARSIRWRSREHRGRRGKGARGLVAPV